MLFTAGIQAALRDRNQPVITTFDFHRLTQGLYGSRQWQGEPLKRLPRRWDQQHVFAMISRLGYRDALTPDRDFGHGVYQVIAAGSEESAEQVACLVDPFLYVSYGSALHRHSLIEPEPSPIHFSTLEARQWKVRQMEWLAGLDADEQGGRPYYARTPFPEVLRGRAIVLHETSAPAPTVEAEGVRVSTLGATFGDTLAEPSRCGGMAAVLDVWNRHAGRYVPEIVEALDRSASKMVKVRAGYIFTERLGIETPAIAAWQAFAQRGGSRRLDPEQPYAPTFSERWMISLNVEAVT